MQKRKLGRYAPQPLPLRAPQVSARSGSNCGGCCALCVAAWIGLGVFPASPQAADEVNRDH
jgi:hypothetical protein